MQFQSKLSFLCVGTLVGESRLIKLFLSCYQVSEFLGMVKKLREITAVYSSGCQH